MTSQSPEAMTPRAPKRPLRWPDSVFDLQDLLQDATQPVYIVGGAVRDAYLGRPIKDIDLVTPSGAINLGRQIANAAGGDIFVLDRERDVARVLLAMPEGRLVIDVARFRADTLYGDLVDRDFTVNAMAADLGGDLSLLIDPLNGERDLIDKVIRRCSPRSVSDDPIRALRAVRQSVQLDARMEPETMADVRSSVPYLNDTSAERVRDEFFKMLAQPKIGRVLRVADALGLLGVVVPEVAAMHGHSAGADQADDLWQHSLRVCERMRALLDTISLRRTDETAANFDLGMVVMALDRFRTPLREHLAQMWPDWRSHESLLILAALLHACGEMGDDGDADKVGVQLVSDRALALHLSNDERQRLLQTVEHYALPLHMGELTPRVLHRFWRDLGVAGIDVCLLALADYLGMVNYTIEQDAWIGVIDQIDRLFEAYFLEYDTIVLPPVLVDGNALMAALDLKPGPAVGNLLLQIREGQAAGEVTTEAEAVDLARRLLDEMD